MFLDRIDKAILRQLQQDASVSNLQLASLVGLSPPACFKRVKKLKSAGVIARQVVLLDQDKLGVCLHMIVNVEMERDRLDLNDGFIKRIRKAPEVRECYQVTGEIDFVLLVTVENMQQYEDFCLRHLYSEANMKNFKTQISMNRVKYDTCAVIPD
ncbi:Lrp/AsnC family transcriptional regulator [Moritella sp. F3]|uniref:Lrp/AsnC family transcriptional regulator n=1 Tax=Moritella sp. F3 TaxID=2718882 RepID=UPI0018E13138|nr:Lrp/AsnC family transcriptional regulator [Moritella sp. F3]GIC75534.1 AsnC family transcriptional regulator [Moritella sp. F1]GIC80679.1 AsnC family transcriptional regulator [Moritella sp. F3]